MSTPNTSSDSQPSHPNSLNSLKADEEHYEKVRIKVQQPSKQKDFARQELYEAHRNPQEEKMARFFDTAFGDIGNFVKRTMGTSYDSKNNFSFSQKQKIMSYIYFRNNQDLQKTRMFTYLDIKAGDTKESVQNRLDHLKEMKDYNRAFYIYNLAQCQNRLRMKGHIWGAVFASVVWNTFMRQSSVIRKGAVAALLIHAGGQLANYKNIDRIFDGLYPIFYKDFKEHLLQEEKEKDDFMTRNPLRDDEITEMIKLQVYNPGLAQKHIESKSLYNEDI